MVSLGRRIKLIVSDIDGTLLNSKREVSKASMDVIWKSRDEGIMFSICTGRIATMTEYYTERLQIKTPIITANGAVIWDCVRKKSIFDVPMDTNEVIELLKMCKSLKLDYSALTLGTSYFSENSLRLNRFLEYNRFASDNGMSEMKLEFFDEEHHCMDGLKVYKVLIYEKELKKLKLMQDYINELPNTGFTSSEPGLIDVSEARVNKGYGLKKLAEHLGLKKEEICVFGDYDNDIPMLENAGFPVAMGNSCENLKEHASLVTKTNDEDGVAWAIRRYILG